MDVARSEAVEKELDAMIRRRHDGREAEEGHRPSEEMWVQSCRVHAEREREREAWERLTYHSDQIRRHTANFEVIVGNHRREVERWEELLGIAKLNQRRTA